MTDEGQELTRKTYEDPDVIAGYIKEHSISPKILQVERQKFVASLSGRKLLDLGCGPGRDSYAFSKLGCDVIGIDYSVAMIDAAKNSIITSAKNPIS